MAPITETASAVLASILPSSLIPTSNYLLPMPASPALDSRVATELQAIEREFSLDGDLLHRTVQQMLWEYRKGLAEHTTDANRDTFLPMMCVQLLPGSDWSAVCPGRKGLAVPSVRISVLIPHLDLYTARPTSTTCPMEQRLVPFSVGGV